MWRERSTSERQGVTRYIDTVPSGKEEFSEGSLYWEVHGCQNISNFQGRPRLIYINLYRSSTASIMTSQDDTVGRVEEDYLQRINKLNFGVKHAWVLYIHPYCM